MPDLSCDIAIIGAGIIGTSIAYHLARRGCTNVVVLEKEINPGMGSTSKAAGGIRAQFNSRINVELSRLSIPDFERFSGEMGVAVKFQQPGYLWIATTREDMKLFERMVAAQRKMGLNVLLLDRAGVAAKAPYARVDDVLGGTFHGRDGYAPPADFVLGYHRKSKELGVRYLLKTPVVAIREHDGRFVLNTPSGAVRAERVVCATGAYSAQIGRMIGVEIPVQPVRRQCFVSEPIREGLPHPIPMTIDFATGIYLHSESGGVLIGLADKEEPPTFNENVDYSFLERIAGLAMDRVPVLEQARIKTGWAGLYEVTPDHHPILGPLPGMPGFHLACGFSGHGFMHAPATGRLMAELLTTEKTSLDIGCLRYTRFEEGHLIEETHVI